GATRQAAATTPPTSGHRDRPATRRHSCHAAFTDAEKRLVQALTLEVTNELAEQTRLAARGGFVEVIEYAVPLAAAHQVAGVAYQDQPLLRPRPRQGERC